MSKSKKRRHSHCFFFKTIGTDGKVHIQKAWAKVREPKKSVELVLTAANVRRSIKLEGVGNTATCSMAVCAIDHKDAFPHPVVGFIDWFYSRVFVASKLDRNGWPSECYRYRHGDSIAKMNDSKNGQQKLLAELERDGDRVIHLSAYKRRDCSLTGGGHGYVDGSRSGTSRLQGAKLRYAVAQGGGVPT